MNSSLFYIILVIILIINFMILGKYNKLVRLQNKVKKAKSNIDVYLKKRFDLIPNIVETVKGYSKHENSTLKDITELRSNYQNHNDLSIKEIETLNNQFNKFLSIVENYPDLKANSQYISLQSELRKIEDQLGNARNTYNDVVTSYNTVIESVPSNIVAALFAFRKADLFEIEIDARDNIKVKL